MDSTKVKKIFTSLILSLLLVFGSFVIFGCNKPEGTSAVPTLPESVTQYNAIPLYKAERFYNIVILTEFKDAKFKSDDYNSIDKAFNDAGSNSKSLRKYYQEQSNGKIDIISVYIFYQSSLTTANFKNSSTSSQVEFVKNALAGQTIYNTVDKSSVFDGNLDYNNDGRIDSITVYLPLTLTDSDYDTAAWPHTILSTQNFNDSFKQLRYNRFVVNCFKYKKGSISLETPIGIMCHEMFHNIGNDEGINDLYHYPDSSDSSFDSLSPVGNYCIMASTDYQYPQPLNAYYKSKLGWLTLKEKAEGGKISFSKTEPEAAKFGISGSEFFIAQYWPASTYNGYPTLEGVVIYRINSSVTTGNMNKPYDEVYVIRKNSADETAKLFNAVFQDNSSVKNLKYSDGRDVMIAVGIEVPKNKDSVNIDINTYSLDFVIGDETVPYDITIKLGINGTLEKTVNGSYIFSANDINKTIYFECFGYEFYSGPEYRADQKIESYTLNDINKFIIKIYIKAIERDITVNLKDFEGYNLTDFLPADIGFTLNNINLGNLPINNFSVRLSNVKNGDKITFKLDGYKIDVLEITPDIRYTVSVNLSTLCEISGIVYKSNGTPLPDVVVKVDGEYATTTNKDGEFYLNNIPQGSVISFEAANYKIEDYKIISDISDLSINAKNIPNYSIYVIIGTLIIIFIIIVITLIKVLTKQKTNFTNESYFE